MTFLVYKKVIWLEIPRKALVLPDQIRIFFTYEYNRADAANLLLLSCLLNTLWLHFRLMFEGRLIIDADLRQGSTPEKELDMQP